MLVSLPKQRVATRNSLFWRVTKKKLRQVSTSWRTFFLVTFSELLLKKKYVRIPKCKVPLLERNYVSIDMQSVQWSPQLKCFLHSSIDALFVLTIKNMGTMFSWTLRLRFFTPSKFSGRPPGMLPSSPLLRPVGRDSTTARILDFGVSKKWKKDADPNAAYSEQHEPFLSRKPRWCVL